MFGTDLNAESLYSQLQLHVPGLSAASGVDFVRQSSVLMLQKELQSNCLRLEALTHIALAKMTGNDPVDLDTVLSCFKLLSQTDCANLEDPAENVFVSSVMTQSGNLMHLEGIWESGSFYLQRVIGMLEAMQSNPEANKIRNSAIAILKVADLLCQRGGLERFCVGDTTPHREVPNSCLTTFKQDATTITSDDLQHLGIEPSDLEPFVFSRTADFSFQPLSNSDLQKHPLLHCDGNFIVALPTAISYAIRAFVINYARKTSTLPQLAKGIELEYARLLLDTRLVGEKYLPTVNFIDNGELRSFEFSTQVDAGRWIHFFFFMDDLSEISKTDLCGPDPRPAKAASTFLSSIASADRIARRNSDFREGITLLVHCGIGRGVYFEDPQTDGDWDCQFLDAASFILLCDADGISGLSFFRLRNALKQLNKLDVTIQNLSGFLNVYEWMLSLHGHLVPHNDLPDEFGGPGGSMIVLRPDMIRDFRQRTLQAVDRHILRDINGVNRVVAKPQTSYFQEDRAEPFYICDAPGTAVYQGAVGDWWMRVTPPTGIDRNLIVQRYELGTSWVCRIAKVLDPLMSDLGIFSLFIEIEFTSIDASNKRVDASSVDFAAVVESVKKEIDLKKRQIRLKVGRAFEIGLASEANVSESAMVSVIIEAVFETLGKSLDGATHDHLHSLVVPNTLARYAHNIVAQTYRNLIPRTKRSPAMLDVVDFATGRLGIGWRDQNWESPRTIEGISECNEYLASVVRKLEDELCEDLRQFELEDVLLRLLENHETSSIDRDCWSKTAPAVLALRGSTPQIKHVIIDHESRRYAACLASRILAEIAICECTIGLGRRISILELQRLISKAISIFKLGGMSDAIRWKAMEPRVLINALGDIQFETAFTNEIAHPVGFEHGEYRIERSVEEYPRAFEASERTEHLDEIFEAEFVAAWNSEFGFSLNDFEHVIAFFEEWGIAAKELVISQPIDVFHQSYSSAGKLDDFDSVVESFSLKPRVGWRNIGEGFNDRDRQPWKFRRSLSVIRKPFLRFEKEQRGWLMCAPGLLRESLAYNVQVYHRGDIPRDQVGSEEMRKWIGRIANRRGSEFSSEVFEQFNVLGWSVDGPELKVTKLLSMGFDTNYGDVDVLAWDSITKRVLLIECKDVQFRKTYGEIAEQLLDFRGGVKDNGKRDELRKHLDRSAIIQENVHRLAIYCGIEKPKIEPVLIFRNPVPMQYALSGMNDQITVCAFAEIEKRFSLSR